jgi:hypothetical protein
MFGKQSISKACRWKRVVGATLIFSAILFGTPGINCESDAFDVFRQNTAGAVGDGLKDIFDGLVDGLVAVAQGESDTSSSSSN